MTRASFFSAKIQSKCEEKESLNPSTASLPVLYTLQTLHEY